VPWMALGIVSTLGLGALHIHCQTGFPPCNVLPNDKMIKAEEGGRSLRSCTVEVEAMAGT